VILLILLIFIINDRGKKESVLKIAKEVSIKSYPILNTRHYRRALRARYVVSFNYT